MIRFVLLTPKGVFLDEEVVSVLIPAYDGPMLLEKGITPSIVACKEAGVLKVNFVKGPRFYAVFHGLAKVREDRIVFLAETVEDGYEIDMARALAKRDRNLDIIARKDPNEDVQYARISLAKQLARIEAKTLGEGGR